MKFEFVEKLTKENIEIEEKFHYLNWAKKVE